jgi:predicted ATPase
VKFKIQERNGLQMAVGFSKLSDGEKCFFLSAAILAYSRSGPPVFCFWDEPDNHLAPAEVSHFVMELRRMVHNGGQFLATSHHPETIRRFSDENTLVFTRNSHLEPTVVRALSEIGYHGDLVSALLRGEVIE